MNIDELREVEGIGDPGIYRYVIANVMDDSDGERQILRAATYDSRTRRVTYQELDAALKQEHQGSRIFHGILGCGILEVHETRIDVFGMGLYGREPDRAQTVAMLRREYPDREILDRS